MRNKLKSLRYRILLPVIVMVLFIVTLLNTVCSRAFIRMIFDQEQEVNAIGFATVSNSVVPLINTSIGEVRNIMSDDRVASYARLQFANEAELIRARKSCRDFLRTEISSRDRIFGLLFMRTDGSLFGTLPEANLFLDDPKDNPLPEAMREKILSAPLGQTVWVGPISGAELCGFESEKTPRSIMIAAWKSVDVRYGQCYEMMLIDESVFDELFASLQDGKSSWYLFSEDQTEIWTSGQEACSAPEQLIRESNSGEIFYDENGVPAFAFSMSMDSPAWTLVRKVSMENAESVVRGVTISMAVLGAGVLLIALAAYELWLRKFMRQFNSMLNGIIRMGQGDLDQIKFERSTISEFETMQQEINITSLALKQQMETIRRMEREQIEQENRRKEQERIAEELKTAREVQANSLPSVFPPFPDRREFSLYASMTPAKEVGGDFYDFFMTDSDHLALVIADVSGKGVPAALFMMVSKSLIKNELLSGYDPAAALTRVNQQLCEHNSSQMFVTVWLAVVELSTGKGLACNAGHEHPAFRRAGGDFELLKYKHGMFIGIARKAKYQNREFELHPGDSIFVYTDGIPEATAAGSEMFGEERLVSALNACPDRGPEEMIRWVKRSVDSFVGDAEQFDDLTMLCLEYRGPEAADGESDGQR